MQTLPISKVKDKLNEYVDSVRITHDQVTITKNGSPAAVLIGADEWESIQETLFWLSHLASARPSLRPTATLRQGAPTARTSTALAEAAGTGCRTTDEWAADRLGHRRRCDGPQ